MIHQHMDYTNFTLTHGTLNTEFGLIFIFRFNNSITCPGGQPDHNPDLMTAKRANTDFAYDYDQVYGY